MSSQDLTQFIRGDLKEQEETQKFIIKAGIIFGLIFGFCFSLFTWGYDAYRLYIVNGSFFWIKLAVGLPISLLVGSIAGWLGAKATNTGITVAVWSLASGLLAWVGGHVPFEGMNALLWMLDENLRGESLLVFNSSASVRTILMILICAVVGVGIGLLESLSLQWSWDCSAENYRFSLGSYLALCISIPMVLLLSLTIDGFINKPLRRPQERVGEMLQLILQGESESTLSEDLQSSYRSFRPYLQDIQAGFETYFVAFGSETGSWYSAYVDVSFPNGFQLRCVTSGDLVVFCDYLGKRFHEWTDQIIRAVLFQERPWLEARIRRLEVNEAVINWLTERRDQISEDFQVTRQKQLGGWIFLEIQFKSGLKIICRLHGAQPAVVDWCYPTPGE